MFLKYVALMKTSIISLKQPSIGTNSALKQAEPVPASHRPQQTESGGEQDSESDEEGPPPAIAPRPDHTKSVRHRIIIQH